jgi:hypothetical protein
MSPRISRISAAHSPPASAFPEVRQASRFGGQTPPPSLSLSTPATGAPASTIAATIAPRRANHLSPRKNTAESYDSRHLEGVGPHKSQVAIQHTGLAGKSDVSARKDYWAERFAALADLM